MFEVSILIGFLIVMISKANFTKRLPYQSGLKQSKNFERLTLSINSISVTISNIDFIKKLPWQSGFK